jgi:hypothetical protein
MGNYGVVREAYAHFWSGITSLWLPMNGSPDRRGVVDVGGEVLWVPDEVFRDVEILLIASHQIQRPKVRTLFFDKVYYNHT